jgi:hypothetical protein
MAGQKQSDLLVVREVELHFFRGMSLPGEAKIRSFLSVLPVLGAPRRSCCQCLVIPEKAARPEMGEERLRDAVE